MLTLALLTACLPLKSPTVLGCPIALDARFMFKWEMAGLFQCIFMTLKSRLESIALLSHWVFLVNLGSVSTCVGVQEFSGFLKSVSTNGILW